MHQAKSENSSNLPQERLHYIDWLRVLAVLGVFFAHTANILDALYWHVNNTAPATTPGSHAAPDYGLRGFVIFGTQWGMSLFFLLAGAGTLLAFHSKTGGQYIHERFNRLLIPCLVGFILFSPLEAYLLRFNDLPHQGSFFAFSLLFFASIRVSWNPQWVAANGFHLWFLAYLFVISLLSLPIILYLRHTRGQRFIGRLAMLCERRGGTAVFLLPLMLIQITLRAPFPGYQSWADFFTWFVFFLYGYILLANPRFERVIQRQGIRAFCIGTASFLLILATYVAGYLNTWEAAPDYSAGYLLYQVLRSITTWYWLIFILYFGIRVLNFGDRLLAYAEEAVLPFYWLHYPVIVISAFYVTQWEINPVLKFFIITTGALMVIVVLYELLIRRTPFSRRLFGMRTQNRELKSD